jgi:glyoxylase-like metal-dependent hydrolase (beta-lactamase superfamily II)
MPDSQVAGGFSHRPRSPPRACGGVGGCATIEHVIVERSMHPAWLSNAYLVADDESKAAVFVDSGAPLEPLVAAVERQEFEPTHLLVTHDHPDHVAGNRELASRYRLEVTSGAVDTGGLHVVSLATPGHSDDGVSFLANGELCFTGDTLFRDSVGGGTVEEVRRSVMDVLLALPHSVRVLPGHTEETTIGREWGENPFVRFWRGLEPEDGRACRVAGRDATVVVWSPDYDGKGKALVRFADGREAILGASRIEL